MMKKLKIVFQTIRAPFLILSPVCVFLGLSVVLFNKAPINNISLVLAVLGALFAHISVNTLNEYMDFKSGLDLQTIRTPFSGGSGALPKNPNMLGTVLNIGILSLMLTLIIGVYFIFTFGVGIIPLGLVGIFLVISYTSWINKYPWLCLVAPGLGFSLFVIGTQYVLAGEYFQLSWMLALIPFFLVNNLLLLNQYPDIDADKQAGRNHFPIAFGVKKSNIVYALFLLATMISLVVFVVNHMLPNMSLLALISMPFALFSLSGAIKYGKNIGQFPQYLAANVLVTLLVPLLLSISLIY